MIAAAFCGCKANDTSSETESVSLTESAAAEEGAEAETVVSETKAEAESQMEEEPSEEEADEPVEKAYEKDMLEAEITVFNMGTHDENYEHALADVRYPGYSLSPECAEAFPELQKTLEAESKKYADSGKKMLKELTEYAEEALAEEYYFTYNTDHVDAEIRRADSAVLSFFTYYENYAGGVHGYYAYGGDNFDVQAGTVLTLADVVCDMDSFKATVCEKISAQYPDIEMYLVDELFENYDGTDNSALPWSMDYSGVTVYFNPYVIGCYAQGAQIINVPFNENRSMFDSRFMDIPEVYVQQLNNQDWAWIDTGDGVMDCVYVDYVYTEEDEWEDGYSSDYKTFQVHFGGDTVILDDYCYYGDFYLVHANDQYYVYAFETSDNDYALLKVVDLKTMTCDNDKVFNASLPGYFGDYLSSDNGYQSSSTTRVFTDPEHLILLSTLDALGTMGGVKEYHVGKDGWPVSDSDYYEARSYSVLSPKENVKCSEGEMEKGKFYQVVKTDNKTWVELQEVDESLVEVNGDDDYKMYSTKDASVIDPDKTLFRLEYDCTGWPKIINGKEETEVFDGIMYAG